MRLKTFVPIIFFALLVLTCGAYCAIATHGPILTTSGLRGD